MHLDGHFTPPPACLAQRPCWLDVDLDAVAANVAALRAHIGPATGLCAVVKAEAYGLGLVPVAKESLRAGAERVAVARVEEGVRLRVEGVTAPILLIAGFAAGEAEEIVRYRLTPTVVQSEDALALGRAAGRAGLQLPVHVKVDTGLTRYGATPADAVTLARLIDSLGSLRLEGLYTHFAAADEPDGAFTRRQLDAFRAVLDHLHRLGLDPPIAHAANSAGTLGEPAARFDMVRTGLALSGHYPADHLAGRPRLRPAVALRARLLRVQDVEPGTTIGYGRTFSAHQQMRVGLVPTGYADGVPRSHSNRAFALVRGTRVRLVGRVSMDQCVVDLSEVPDARGGDVVTLIGAADGDRIALEEYAGWSDTITHEALCRVGARVPRRYRRGDTCWWGTETMRDERPALLIPSLE
ncbi:MAG: alanine racemase [Chloroflexota bacterium]|nr:alanine racemase [Chloroflexota bacterium]